MPEPDEVELTDYLNTLWKWKFLILVGTLVTAIIVLAVNLGAGRTYEATVILEITEAKVPGLEVVLKSQSIAIEAIQQFGLDKEPFATTPIQFFNNTISITHRHGTNILALTAALPDPKLAAEVANFVAQKAVESSVHSSQTDIASIRDELQRQLDQAQQTMRAAQFALTGFKRTANLESLREEWRILLNTKAQLAQFHSNLTLDLSGLQAEVAKLRQALIEQEQFLTVSKSIISDPAMLAAAQDRGPMDLRTLSSIQLKNQEINGVYQTLQSDLISKEATLVSLERKRRDAERQIKEQAQEFISTKSRIADTDARLEELTTHYSLAQEAYGVVVKKVDEASRSAVASRATEMKIVNPAVVPAVPRSRKIKQNVVLASTAALMICAMLAFFLEYFGRPRGSAGRP
jgi:uncharacterized protein involved in exopolysaccharide biosynthesis